MKKHMTQEAAIKSAWMILEGLGFSREINGDLEKTVTAVYESAPAADVVEVVRCRECEFWERDRITCEGVARCRTGESGVRFRSGHDYCSRGILKRKEGGQDDGD